MRSRRDIAPSIAGHEVGQDVDRGRHAGEQLVRQRAELEALGHLLASTGAACRDAGSRAGRATRRACRCAGRGTCTGCRRRSRRRSRACRWARARSGARRRRSSSASASATASPMAATSGRVPSRLDAPVTATSRVRSVSSDATSSTVRHPGARVELGPPHGGARALGVRDPGADVAVVVEPRDDDLVAGTPLLGQRAGDLEGQLGHAAAEDDARGVGVDEVGAGHPRGRS